MLKMCGPPKKIKNFWERGKASYILFVGLPCIEPSGETDEYHKFLVNLYFLYSSKPLFKESLN